MCGDQLSRLCPSAGIQYASQLGLVPVDTIPTLRWYMEHRLINQSFILPRDPPERAKLIMQFAEKRMVRRIPWSFSSATQWLSMGTGVNQWVGIFAPLQTMGISCQNLPWPSEVALFHRLGHPKGNDMRAHILTFTMPRDERDIIF